MEYIAYAFSIFGLLAYIELSSLKKRIADLERQLTKMKGTSYAADRKDLLATVKEYIGRPVILALKEDNEDSDVIMYGNSKHGTNTILDADEEWLLVRIESAKGTKEKLLRLESVRSLSLRS